MVLTKSLAGFLLPCKFLLVIYLNSGICVQIDLSFFMKKRSQNPNLLPNLSVKVEKVCETIKEEYLSYIIKSYIIKR